MKVLRHQIHITPLTALILFLYPVFSEGVMVGYQNGTAPHLQQDEDPVRLIDDFSRPDGRSSLGTIWRSFSDQVMGGLSRASYSVEVIQGRRCMRLQGSVSLENNGGFVQAALPLATGDLPFDAGRFTGIQFWTLGNGDEYFIHLRSEQTQRPWQYYAVSFETGERWRRVRIPFSRFRPENLNERLDSTRLTRVAVVGAWREFVADVAVARIEFYR